MKQNDVLFPNNKSQLCMVETETWPCVEKCPHTAHTYQRELHAAKQKCNFSEGGVSRLQLVTSIQSVLIATTYKYLTCINSLIFNSIYLMTLKIISFTLAVAFQSSKWVKMNRTQVG